MVLEPKAVRSVDFDPPAEWVSLREWDLFGADYGRTADVVTNHLVLHYPQSEWAELDAAVMSRPPTPHSRHCSLPSFAARSLAGMSGHVNELLCKLDRPQLGGLRAGDEDAGGQA